MTNIHARRTEELQRRMADGGLDGVLLTDPDSIAYFAGFWNYLGVEFGRPTLVFVPRSDSPSLITPLMESEMCRAMAWIGDVRPWEDGVGGEWTAPLHDLLSALGNGVLGLEQRRIPALVSAWIADDFGGLKRTDATPLLGAIRMIKDTDEIAILRQAGQVAVAMVEGALEVIAEGVAEYEVALAVIGAGTRKAAGFLADEGMDRFHSPMVHNLQILQSGAHTCMVHRRPNVRRLAKGDPIYLCFCGITSFRHYKPGFDREFFIGSVTDKQARVYETTVAAQQAALAQVRPGVAAEEVNAAADEVYRSAGFAAGYRTGRGFGYSYLEEPQIKRGDGTRLQAGMALAVDGGITLAGEFGARVGDSIIVTDGGFEYLTDFPRDLRIL